VYVAVQHGYKYPNLALILTPSLTLTLPCQTATLKPSEVNRVKFVRVTVWLMFIDGGRA